MSRDDASGWQDHLPLDDAPAQPADTDEVSGADPWGDDPGDPFADPGSANLFSAEIENVNASDWDIDTASIWGDEIGDTDIDGGGEALGLDLPF